MFTECLGILVESFKAKVLALIRKMMARKKVEGWQVVRRGKNLVKIGKRIKKVKSA